MSKSKLPIVVRATAGLRCGYKSNAIAPPRLSSFDGNGAGRFEQKAREGTEKGETLCFLRFLLFDWQHVDCFAAEARVAFCPCLSRLFLLNSMSAAGRPAVVGCTRRRVRHLLIG